MKKEKKKFRGKNLNRHYKNTMRRTNLNVTKKLIQKNHVHRVVRDLFLQTHFLVCVEYTVLFDETSEFNVWFSFFQLMC